MSNWYGLEPIDFAGLKTISLYDRGGKVQQADFARVYQKGNGIKGFLGGLPHILAADHLRAVVDAIGTAHQSRKPVIWGIGGHVIKCGLAPILIDLMHRGFATALAMNGSASIHDFEIGLAGQTSEDVESVLPDGRFGSADETGREWNAAIADAMNSNYGAGEALGRSLDRNAPEKHAPASLLLQAFRAHIPVTVHIAIGTDTPHTHPDVSAQALGAASHFDFRLFCSLTAKLNRGGVYINAGSAVIMPEVFLKAVSCVRNLGNELRDFTTVNLDFLPHYRTRVNVLERPHMQSGGRGFDLRGHHEIMVPLLAAALIEKYT